jgi:hypothetical protein
MHNVFAGYRRHPDFTDSSKRMHNYPHKKSRGGAVMTMTLVWASVAMWVGLNIAFAARRTYVTWPDRTVSAQIITIHPRRA